MVYTEKIVNKYLTAICLILQCCDGILQLKSYDSSSPLSHSIGITHSKSESDDFLLRTKRNVITQTQSGTFQRSISGKEPIITYFELQSTHQQVMVDWAGRESQVVICVTKDSLRNENSSSSVYISYDYGSSFVDKTNLFKVGNQHGIIYSFFKSDKFDRFVFTDTINKFLFTTIDFGHTIQGIQLEFISSEVSMHPTNAAVFVIMDQEDVEKKLWVTSDFGFSFSVLSQYVKSYHWSKKSSSPALYVERAEPDLESTVIAYTSFPENGNFEFKPVISGIRKFDVKEDFLFAVKKKPRLLGATNFDDTLQLWVQYMDGPFLLAKFPNDLSHQHYYIADVSNGQIMVCVFHGITSNLYVSSVHSSPNDQVQFSLSLERILYFSPNTNWNNTWLNKKAEKAFADLYRVEGMRGVFIASQLSSSYSKISDTLGPEHLNSLITFDQGGEWAPLRPPKIDSDGKTVICSKEKNCSLHISQELGELYPVTQSKSILSTKSAPGMILSMGTLGTSLKGHPGLFLSTDAGVNWYQILKGNYLFTLGDHGGVMVVVQHYRASNLETDEIMYSIDEGETWFSHQFFPEKIRVYGLMTKPGENTTIFSLFGSKMAKHEWIIVKIDMKSVFERKCTKNDYKMWTPFDPEAGRHCLLGRRESYERRAPHSNCFNGINYDQPVSSEVCPCTRADYECDYGFMSVKSSGGEPLCSKDTLDVVNPFLVPSSCNETGFYERTKGYRKIPGDECVGGMAENFEPEKLPCPVREEMDFLLVSNRKTILRYNLLNPSEGLRPLPIEGIETAIALDFHMKNNCLYWSDASSKKILRQCFNGKSEQETIVEKEIGSVEGIALDWVSNSLYFVDGDRKTVDVVSIKPRFKGRLRKNVLKSPDIDRPRGIALHVVNGHMYITDWSDAKPMVGRANLDGSDLKILFGNGQVSWPNGIAIDHQSERIFWADAKLDYIASANLDGSDKREVISGNDLKQPYSVAVYKSFMFWDDWGTYKIFQAEKENGMAIVPLSSKNMEGLVDIKVFGRWTQSGSNACGDDSTRCQFFCVGKPSGSYSCLCPDWLKSVPNGKSTKCVCEDGSDPLQNGACKVFNNTCGEMFFRCDNDNCVPKSMMCDMQNDCGDNSDEKNCGKNVCDAASWQCKNGHCISPAWKCDIADDCGDNSDEENCVYPKCSDDQFTCQNHRCIDKNWVCDMQDDCQDGSDELNCTLSHSNKSCSLMQFQCKMSGQCLPLSWRCDGENDCSDDSDEDDCSDHTCTHLQFQCTSKKCIYQTWVCDGDDDCDDGIDEKNCSSITTPMPSTWSPMFPIWNKNNTCKEFEFKCNSGNCIPFWWRCDSAFDCQDGSDEDDCDEPHSESTPSSPHVTTTITPTVKFACREDQMECGNGDCIWESWVCDGEKDCPDGEDEENCKGRMCPPDHFRCWLTEGCIEFRQRCNGHPDCPDGSDELGCHIHHPNSSSNPEKICSDEYFSCDGGFCFPLYKKCDQNIDCIDLSDEELCEDGSDSKAYYVKNLSEVDVTNTTLAIKWDFDPGSDEKSFEFLPSCIIQAALGNSAAWKNGTWTQDKNYTFVDLHPYTIYHVKVFVREIGSNKTFPPAELLTMTTEEGVPTPPVNVRVAQVVDRLLVTWDEPREFNGPIKSCTLYVSPPNPAETFEIKGIAQKFFFLPPNISQKYKIWMTCSNFKYTSSASDPVFFTPLTVDQTIKGFSLKSQNGSTASLVWEAVEGVDGYVVSYSYPENQFMGTKFTQNVSTSHIEMTKLSPGLSYLFEVRAYKDSALGPISSLKIKTMGEALPSVVSLKSEVLKASGTTLNITWKEPLYKQKHIWQYEVLWGKSISELKKRMNVGTTTNTSFIVRHLHACDEYLVAVFLAGPVGYGPATNIQVNTKEDVLAPPKDVAVKTSADKLNITWLPPCPTAVDFSLRYLVKVTETHLNEVSYFDLPTKKESLLQSHWVTLHYGGGYEVSIRTYLNNSRFSSPLFANGPEIPAPFDLTFNPSDCSFFWRIRHKSLPAQLVINRYSYVLFLVKVEGNNSSIPDIQVEVKEPPYQATEMEPGRVYYASVAFKDHEGYLSRRSQSIRVERPIGDGIVVTPSSMVGVAVSITIVIVALVIVVALMALRHKRLARSFAAFANSHYSRSQGTTRITTDHNLDDDDSPMIRGFSDDEPLVIA